MGYKMMLSYRGKYIALKTFFLPHFSKTMRNSYILILCLIDICFFPTEPASFFSGLLELVMGYKMMLNFRRFFPAVLSKQSVDSLILLFEVHITFGFQSEVPTLFFSKF